MCSVFLRACRNPRNNRIIINLVGLSSCFSLTTRIKIGCWNCNFSFF